MLILKEEKALVGRVLHHAWILEEIDSGPGSHWTLEVPPFFTITLLEVELVEGGEATEISPFLGLGESAEADSLGEIVVSEDAAKHLRFEESVRVTAVGPGGVQKLHGKSRPDGIAGRIHTRLTIQYGHQA